MEFKYWCPQCEETIVHEGFRIRRQSCCTDSGDMVEEGYMYLKALLWLPLLIWVLVAFGVVIFMISCSRGLIDPVIGVY